ncbi:MAG: LacI family transcriptional regulator [Verrucomicrobiae bacterium]|nr:LacI family transcriptional regulator [Verrucomicrobiae bacterium]
MVTQKEIASRLGVSPSLVSRALSGTATRIGASAKTVARIRAEAAKLNYQPSAAALSLRGNSTRTIGVVVKNFDDPFFGRIIAELQTLAANQRYSLLLTGCTPTPGLRVDIHSLAKFQLDGLIIAGSDFEPDGLDAFRRNRLPIARIGTGTKLRGVLTISVDWQFGIQKLLEHLMQLGHRDIGYLGDESQSNLRRETILQNAMRRAGLVVRPHCFVRARSYQTSAGYEAMLALLNRCGGRPPTAVVAAEDVLALSALRVLYEKQLRVPHDLTLVGIDDIPAARTTIPALTTIRQPIADMVQAAFQHIVQPRQIHSEICLRPELVVRESSAPPPKEIKPA